MQVEALFKEHQDIFKEESYRDDAVQSIHNNVRWLASNGAAVCAWLNTAPPVTMRIPGLAGVSQAPAAVPGMARAQVPGTP